MAETPHTGPLKPHPLLPRHYVFDTTGASFFGDDNANILIGPRNEEPRNLYLRISYTETSKGPVVSLTAESLAYNRVELARFRIPLNTL